MSRCFQEPTTSVSVHKISVLFRLSSITADSPLVLGLLFFEGGYILCIMGLFGKEGSGTTVFKIQVRALMLKSADLDLH